MVVRAAEVVEVKGIVVAVIVEVGDVVVLRVSVVVGTAVVVTNVVEVEFKVEFGTVVIFCAAVNAAVVGIDVVVLNGVAVVEAAAKRT